MIPQKKITQEFVEVVDLKNNLETVGFMDTIYSNAKQLNITLHQNNIETPKQKSHFLAQCAYETNFGMWLTEIGSKQIFLQKLMGISIEEQDIYN